MTEPKAPRDEGAAQTRLIMNAVRSARMAKDWSAERLASEMTAVGVPWNEHIIVNLEHGRRRSLRVHEWLALAYVLEAEPLDLLVPATSRYPVTPDTMVTRPIAKAWVKGEIGPLRTTHTDAVAEFRAVLEQQGKLSKEDINDVMNLLAPMLRSFDPGTTD